MKTREILQLELALEAVRVQVPLEAEFGLGGGIGRRG